MATGLRKLIKSESQPIILPIGTAGGQQIYFPDNQYIRNKKLMGLTLTINGQNLFGLAPQTYVDGTELIDLVYANQIYITLESYSGVQFIRKKPLMQFVNVQYQGVGVINSPEFIGQKVNWPKSYIEIANGTAAIAKKLCVLFDVEFTELNAETIRQQLAPTFGEKR